MFIDKNVLDVEEGFWPYCVKVQLKSCGVKSVWKCWANSIKWELSLYLSPRNGEHLKRTFAETEYPRGFPGHPVTRGLRGKPQPGTRSRRPPPPPPASGPWPWR